MRLNQLLSVRVSEKVVERLEKLSKAMDRSRSYIAVEAIEEYLDLHEWQIKGIQAGLRDIENGKVIDFEKIKVRWEKKK